MHRTLAQLLGVAIAVTIPTPAWAEPGPDPVADQATQDARAAVARARDAASRGAWAEALEGFEAAMRLRPSPKLHYNIAVSHHRMSLAAAKGSPERASASQAAIEAYTTYLAEVPDARDRDAVEATIRELGGTVPAPEVAGAPKLDERDYSDLWDRPPEVPGGVGDAGNAAGPADAGEPEIPETDPSPPAQPPRPPRLPRVRIGAGIATAVLHPVDAIRSAAMDIPLAAGLLVHGAALLGRKRAIALGAEIALLGALPLQPKTHGVSAGYLGITVDYTFALGTKRRVELAAGGLLGGGGESLRERETPTIPPTCPIGSDGEVSKRGGVLIGVRAGLFVLLGKKRNHAIALRTLPSLVAMGNGDKAQNCPDDPAPFKELGMPAGAGFGIVSDLGYMGRF